MSDSIPNAAQPDPQLVRAMAREAAKTSIEDTDYVGIAEQFCDDDRWPADEDAADALHRAIADDLRGAVPTWPDEQPQDERDVPRPGLLCRTTVMNDDGRHYCTLNTAAHAVHQCGDCGYIWTDSGEEFEVVLAERNQLRLEAATQAEREADLRAVAEAIDALDFVLENGYSADIAEGARTALYARFADGIAALDARTTDGGTS